jgi:hypothetical protein
MCTFLSGLAFGPKLEGKFGKFYADPTHTDSHSDMERKLGLPARNTRHWAKWEFVPEGDLLDFDSYKFQLDSMRKPDWWSDEIEVEAKQFALQNLAECIVSENLETLYRDVYTICAKSVVNNLCSNVRIMRGSSQVGVMRGSAQVGKMLENAIARRFVDGQMQILHAPNVKIQLATVADITEWKPKEVSK